MQVTHAFPAVLEKLELHAFDLCKMIEPFVRYQPSIPQDLKRHLQCIEEKIIECLALEQGSSFYPQLVAAYDMSTDRQTAAKLEGECPYRNCSCTPDLYHLCQCHLCYFNY